MSLAITEKRQPQQRRPAGCAGIFVQLFDWNRRLAKKKLFSKKFLPPVRAVKKASKRFGGDDKMPVANKLLLIADENCGGFPSTKKPEADACRSSSPDDRGNEMHAPGLVARLMGLESMPVVQQDKPRRALNSGSLDDRGGSNEYSRLDQGLCQEMAGHRKLETRPQKLQKTGGFLERRRPVGAPWLSPEVLSKNVLARSKRQHRQLASPVRSPRLLSRSNTARLVQAASKILEPGLQSRNRARCAITYMAADAEGSDANLGLKNSKEPLSDSLVGPCRSCGNLVEVSELRLGTREPVVTEYGPSALDFSNAPSSHNGFEEGKMEEPVPPTRRNRTASLAVQAKLNVESRAQAFPERRRYLRNDQDRCKPWQDATSKSTLRKNNSRQNQLPLVKDKVIRGNNFCSRKLSGHQNESNEAKNFVPLNRNLNDHSRTRPATKASNDLRVEAERNAWEKNTARKRRPVNCPQTDNVGALISTSSKQRSVGNDSTNRKGAGLTSNQSINRDCIDSESWKNVVSSSTKDNGIVSFTFSSPMSRHSRALAHQEMIEKSRCHGKLTRDASHSKKLVSDAKSKNSYCQKGTTLQGDHRLSNLLQQKIKELTSLDQDEFATGYALPERSTAAVLEELISALTTEAPIPQKNGDNSYKGIDDLSDCTISHDQMLAINMEFQGEAKAGNSASFLASDIDQPSPISILEASFSNDSCSVGSPNCSSGGKPPIRLTEFCDKQRTLDLDNDLLDSATSITTKESDTEEIPRSIDKNSIIHGISGTKFSHASEAILNAELLFENTSLHESDRKSESSVYSFIINTLEAVMDDFYVNSTCSSVSKEAERNQLRELLFDGIIECLDSKYRRFCQSGYRAWLKIPAFLSRDRLVKEVHNEIRGWRDLAGNVLDDLIEKELSLSTLKWTEFEIEAFEAGIEIESDILMSLVDEVVIDLC